MYDCGVSIRHEWQVNHVVTQAFTDEDEIDILFISLEKKGTDKRTGH